MDNKKITSYGLTLLLMITLLAVVYAVDPSVTYVAPAASGSVAYFNSTTDNMNISAVVNGNDFTISTLYSAVNFSILNTAGAVVDDAGLNATTTLQGIFDATAGVWNASYLIANLGSDGNYTLSTNVTATDNSEFGYVANLTFVRDTVAPEARAEITNDTLIRGTTTLSSTVTDAGSGIASIGFNVTNQSDAVALANVVASTNTASSDTWTASFNPSSVAGQAARFFVDIHANDTAGNQGYNSTTYNVSYDPTPANLTFDMVNADNSSTAFTGSGINGSTRLTAGELNVWLNVSANDTNVNNNVVGAFAGAVSGVEINVTREVAGASVKQITATQDSADTTLWSATYHFNNTLADGTYNVVATVTDNAGNQITSLRTVVVDYVTATTDTSSSTSSSATSNSKGSQSADSSLVTAGQTVDAGETASDAGSAKQYRVGKGGVVSFSVNGAAHTMTVDSVSGTASATVTLRSEPVTVEIEKGETVNVDLDGNGTDDVAVNLEKILSSKAYLKVWKLTDEPTQPKTTEPTTTEPSDSADGEAADTDAAAATGNSESGSDDLNEPLETPKKGGSNTWVWVLLVLIVVGAVVYFSQKKK